MTRLKFIRLLKHFTPTRAIFQYRKIRSTFEFKASPSANSWLGVWYSRYYFVSFKLMHNELLAGNSFLQKTNVTTKVFYSAAVVINTAFSFIRPSLQKSVLIPAATVTIKTLPLLNVPRPAKAKWLH